VIYSIAALEVADMKEQLGCLGEDDWSVLTRFFPLGWEEKAREFGALQRCRGFPDAERLLRTLLIHLGDGCSLKETVVRAKHGGLVDVSSVALFKRLKLSGEWLRWMACSLMTNWFSRQSGDLFGPDLRVRLIDGSNVQEPGSTGSSWKIHYSVGLPSLLCDEVYVTGPKIGESFKRFKIRSGDLLLGDKQYAKRPGIAYVVGCGGDVLVRTNLQSVSFLDENGASFPLLDHLRTIKGTKLGDWDVWVKHDKSFIPGRVCALRKSKKAREAARLKTLRQRSKKGKVRPETLEAAEYTFVFTTLPRRFGPMIILETYRGRWQVELAFKRLKSIIGLGHLRKVDLDGAKAWLHGKLLVAFLTEALIIAGTTFSPWGYALIEES
jgi:hypothetical protein